MNQTTSCSAADLQMHHNFRWVLYANHIEPVRSFLGRYLRRQQLTASTATALAVASSSASRVSGIGQKDSTHHHHQQPKQTGLSNGDGVDTAAAAAAAATAVGTSSGDIARVVEWLPKVWQRINRFLETHTSCDITIG
jgi:hypothetical protein